LEAKLQRLTAIYAALNQCSQSILRCTGEDELFVQICRYAVQLGGMRMAWIGMVDDASGVVRPVAFDGVGLEYLDDIRISIDADDPSGRGTTGTAIRENRAVYIQDFQHDPRLTPWHERAARYGWAGVAALPLHRNGIAVGALMFYATVVDAFDEAASNLLEGMASDIDLALEKFETEARRKQAEDALLESEARTRMILETAMDAVIHTDQQGDVIGWNREAERVFGYTQAYATGKNLADLIVPQQYREAHLEGMRRFIQTERGRILDKRIEITGMRKDGTEFPIEMSLAAILRNGEYFFSAFVRDITERKKADEALRITAVTFDAQESIMITDGNGNILRINQAFEEMTGYTAAEVIGKNPRIFQSGRHDAAYYRAMWASLHDTGKWSGEIWDKRKDGNIYPKQMTITSVYDSNQGVSHYVAVSRDITGRKQSEEAIHQLAFYDPLTGLPNRRLLMDRLQQVIAVSARNGWYGALMFLDLDNFKVVNDTKGHAVGDHLLVETSKRLQSCIREGDTVARLGGDEFVVVLEELGGDAHEAATRVELVAEKVLGELGRNYVLGQFDCVCPTSIGICIFKGHDESLDDLLKHADAAMYQAKTAGRNTLRFYDPAMQAALEARIELEGELRQAINKQQLQLYFQLQIDRQNHPLGAEVLLRWIHPERGFIPPLQFIPLAEETGLIGDIGQWVLQMAGEQLKVWQGDPVTRNLTLSVNVSAKQFHEDDFVAQVQRVLRQSGAHPKLLKLELTESTVLENVEDAIAKMRELKKLGIGFSMDDFGTGYSSLQYLKRLPLDQIKIDQSFVRDIATDPNDEAIVKTIIAMTDALGFDVIAEGVETESQREFLDKHGCHAFQGYLFSQPVPLPQFELLLRR